MIDRPTEPLRILQVAAFTSFFDRFSMAPLLLLIAADLHSSLAGLATAAGLYYLMYGIMQPVSGVLMDRLGRIPVMRWALAGAALFAVLSAVAPNFGVFMVARALTAACFAGIVPTVLVYIGDTFPIAIRQRAFSDILLSTGAGTALGTLGGGVVGHFVSWRLVFLFPAVICLLLLPLIGRLPEPYHAGPRIHPLRQLQQIVRHSSAVAVLSLGFLEGVVLFGFLTYLAPAVEVQGYDAATAGVVMGVYGVGVLLASRVTKPLSGKLPGSLLILIGGLMFMLGYAIASINQGPVAVMITSLLLGAGYPFVHTTLQTWTSEVIPQVRAVLTSFFVASVLVGGAVATDGAAPLASHHAFATIFLVATGLAVPLTFLGALARHHFLTREVIPAPAEPTT